MGARRVLLIGWDAADWKMIHPLMDAGLMPALKGLVERGVSGNLATLSPVLSPMLWSSIATGKRPFKHGVLGFTEPTPDGQGVRPVTSLSRKARAMWNILTLEGRTSNVVGWWPSHPAEPIRGVMVSNHYQRAPRRADNAWPMAAGTVHPERLAGALAELRFHPAELTEEHLRLFVPEGHRIDQERDRRLDTLARIIADCTSIHAAATHLIEEEPSDFTAVYYDAIDHFGHAFMKYHPPKQDFVSQDDFEIYRQVVTAGYLYHDMMLGRLLELAGEETVVMLVSDHGFHPDHLRPSKMPLEPAGPAIEHRDQGIFVMAGPGVKRDTLITGASLLDIAPTVLTLFGLPVGEDMDGRPLVQAFETAPEIRTIPSWEAVDGDAGRHPDDEAIDPAAARESLEQLVALGYIERPDADQGKAVANTVREQQYNLALAYMDAGMHPKAAEILAGLYAEEPLEFRFGIRLAICLQAMEQPDTMAEVIAHLDANWRRAAERARARLAEIRSMARERRAARTAWQAGDTPEAAEADAEAALAEAEAAALAEEEAAEDGAPRPDGADGGLFTPAERKVIRSLRGIGRGNPQTLDYLAASIATARGDPEGALGHLEAARQSESRVPGFHLQVGNAFLAARRHAEAADSYRRALELDPENPGAHLGLCRVALAEGRDTDGLAAAQTAVGLKYHFPVGHFFLARALVRQGRIREAMEAAERALEQNPNFPEAHVLLALMHRRLGDRVRATEARLAARRVRDLRRSEKAERAPLALPPLGNIDVDAHLPAWPEPAPQTMLPALGQAPVADARAKAAEGAPAIVVSGLPRSGTSMAMQMLVAGGIAPVTDATRAADESNPLGYLEDERVKRLQSDNAWLDEARGRALKVVAPLVPCLPQSVPYRVILMERDLDEIAGSQAKMLERLGREGGDLGRETLRRALGRQIEGARRTLSAHGVPVLALRHRDVLDDPAGTAERIARFIDRDLDLAAMAACVDVSLWRERSQPASV